jgi:SWI/SNF-related matrix-associated actin-dependent regulator of chromatin subfamily D
VRPIKTGSVLRLNIYNTYSNQEAVYHVDSSFGATLNDSPSWTLRMEGRVLENAVAGANFSPTSLPTKPTTNRKFSSFFSKIFIQLDKELYPDNDIIEWHKAAQPYDCDGFEVKRPGNQETTAKIVLHLDHQPPQYKISPELGRILGMKDRAETRARILMQIWQYIKVNKLQDPEDRKTVINNSTLKDIFGCDRMQFSQIPQLLTEHISPPEPYEIDFRIKLSGTPTLSERVFDIQIQLDDPASINSTSATLDSTAKEIDQLDEQISKHIQEINKLKRKRDFMLQFSKAPVEFINSYCDTQLRDYKITTSEPTSLDEEERRSNFYYHPFVVEAVEQFVQSSVTPQ